MERKVKQGAEQGRNRGEEEENKKGRKEGRRGSLEAWEKGRGLQRMIIASTSPT